MREEAVKTVIMRIGVYDIVVIRYVYQIFVFEIFCN